MSLSAFGGKADIIGGCSNTRVCAVTLVIAMLLTSRRKSKKSCPIVTLAIGRPTKGHKAAKLLVLLVGAQGLRTLDPLIVRVSGSRSPKRAIRLSKKDWHSRAPEVSALPEMKSILERHGATATSPKKGDGPHDRSEHPYVAASFKRPQGAESNMNYTRTEAGRILLSASRCLIWPCDRRLANVRCIS